MALHVDAFEHQGKVVLVLDVHTVAHIHRLLGATRGYNKAYSALFGSLPEVPIVGEHIRNSFVSYDHENNNTHSVHDDKEWGT